MIVEYKFAIEDDVTIKALEWPGQVISLFTGRKGNEIQVRYFWNGEAKEVYFYENELESIK